MIRALRLGLLGVAVAALAACSADKPKPTPLETVAPQIAGRLVWSTRVDTLNFPMAPTLRDGQFIVAGGDGTVLALDAQTGREQWRGSAGARLSAGVGSDGRFAAVVTRDNDLVVLERGALRWKTGLKSSVTAAPLVAGERVFVMGVDRAVHAFDALDGRRLWTLQRPGEALTLSQPGVLAAYKDTLVAGQGALLTGVDPLRGTVRWELPMAAPRGTNEVERLADLVGPLLRVGNLFCARAFQAAVACADLDKPAVRWTRNAGGTQGVGGDADYVFGADATDRVTAWRMAGGETAWTQERLLYRGLSAPLSLGRAVVFGDVEGQLHFLARDTGQTLLRLPTDGSAVIGAPLLAGTTMLVATRNGGLFAFRPE
jgi:outer membrane protein assembly factor BamB